MNSQKTHSHFEDKLRPITEAEMLCAGITRVPADMFYYKDYKYTNLKDAMAQSKRDTAATHSSEP
jgi:hypothetical protein